MKNNGKTKKPISDGWIPLGDMKGISWCLWHNSVVLQRKVKEADKWLVTEEIHLAPTVLKEIFWLVPNWLKTMSDGRKNG